ncbi:MAG: type I methionyl aminopeptidase [Thermodesulfobacteriota bacterium]
MVILKSADEIRKMKVANKTVARILARLTKEVGPGITTRQLDRLSERLCSEAKVLPAFKGYQGYPYALCASVNHQVVHAFPNETPLREGDILSMDFGVLYEGFYGDAAVTVPVGEISPEAAALIRVTRQSLLDGIAQARVGNRLSDISAAVQFCVEAGGFSVVRKFVGHGIGRSLHEEPQVRNYGEPGKGLRLRAGMTLAIEPMVNAGGYDVEVLEDGWTAVTKDGSLSAHFEHSIAITEDGPEILSLTD